MYHHRSTAASVFRPDESAEGEQGVSVLRHPLVNPGGVLVVGDLVGLTLSAANDVSIRT